MSEDKIEVRAWIGFTASALAGFLGAVLTMTVMFTDLQRDTAAALKRANDNAHDIDTEIRPRITKTERALERIPTDVPPKWFVSMVEDLKTAVGKLDDRVDALGEKIVRLEKK